MHIGSKQDRPRSAKRALLLLVYAAGLVWLGIGAQASSAPDSVIGKDSGGLLGRVEDSGNDQNQAGDPISREKLLGPANDQSDLGQPRPGEPTAVGDAALSAILGINAGGG
jgi:hypothetical protein